MDNVVEVALAHSAGAMVVTVRGEIDTVSVPTLKAALDGIDPTSTVSVDMAGVTFMDSSGLSALAVQTMRVRAEGGSLTISHPSSSVRRVVELAGMGELLEERMSL
jgi:anti-sigma B factor antagonist